MSENVNILKKLYRAVIAGKEHFNADHQWPQPRVNLKEEPHFLFIITPPYSGSTALAQILNSCRRSCFLQKKAEGQMLVPGMWAAPGLWDPATVMNWNSIRAVWLARVKLIKEVVQDVDIIIEKSTPNLLRIDQLIKVFPNNTVFAYNRNPFANCASILYRRHNPTMKSDAERIEIIEKLAKDWLFRSRWIKKWIEEMNLIYFTYEDFCSDPELCISRIAEILPVLRSVDVKKSIKVKEYEPAVLKNHNTRQIDNLKRKEIDAISDILKTDSELVAFFGYDFVHVST